MELSLGENTVSGRSIVLISNDEKKFGINSKHASISTVIHTMLDGDNDMTEAPLQVPGTILALIIEYMNNHGGVKPESPEHPLRSTNMADCCKVPIDAVYIDRIASTSMQQLYDLMKAANYMDIKPLTDLCCAKVGSLIRGKSLEAAKAILAAPTAPAPITVAREEKR